MTHKQCWLEEFKVVSTFEKSIYILCNINYKRESNLIIMSINVGTALGKIQQILWRTIDKDLNNRYIILY